jgi:hypothetical protein
MRKITLCWALSSVLLVLTYSAMAQGIAQDLVLYYTFEGDSGDVSGAGRQGDLIGGAELKGNESSPAGGSGSAEFGGDPGNMVDCGGGGAVQQAKDYTLMCWVKPDDAARTQFSCGTPYDDEEAWDDPWVGHQIGVRGGKMATWLNLAAVDREYDSGAISAGEWTHTAFTFDGDIAKSYVNGEEVAANDDRDGETEFSGDPHFYIGERSGPALGEPYGGLIDEVAFFKRVLSQDEIKTVMGEGIALSVDPAGKMAASWGYIKTVR